MFKLPVNVFYGHYKADGYDNIKRQKLKSLNVKKAENKIFSLILRKIVKRAAHVGISGRSNKYGINANERIHDRGIENKIEAGTG